MIFDGSDGQRYELVIEADVDVIPGPLSKIRDIALEALADPGVESAHSQLAAILAIIEDGVDS